jgi:hypothetical protein
MLAATFSQRPGRCEFVIRLPPAAPWRRLQLWPVICLCPCCLHCRLVAEQCGGIVEGGARQQMKAAWLGCEGTHVCHHAVLWQVLGGAAFHAYKSGDQVPEHSRASAIL